MSQLGSSDAAPGSGAACALALLLATEALQSQLSLTLKKGVCVEHRAFQDELQIRLNHHRAATRRLFEADADAFESVVKCRVARDKAKRDKRRGDEEEQVRLEMEFLKEANAALLEMINLAKTLAEDALAMFSGKGTSRAAGEAAVARYLAVGATNALADILTLNLEAMCRRKESYETASGLAPPDGAIVLAENVPDSSARDRLLEVLKRLGGISVPSNNHASSSADHKRNDSAEIVRAAQQPVED